MSCITSTSISVLPNGSYTNFFQPTRGVRQGDPLSSYIFIPCMEILSRRICSQEDRLYWTPITLAPRGPPPSHLFFANVIILCPKIDRT